MLLNENLDLDTAEDGQLDLYLLVDSVLDEIELAKQAAFKQQVDEDLEIMPEASDELYLSSDFMDHFGSPPHYSDSDQSYASPETTSYISNRSFQNGHDSFSSLPAELAEELIQSDIENSCLSYYPRRDISDRLQSDAITGHNDYHMEQYGTREDHVVHDVYTHSPVQPYSDFQQNTESDRLNCQADSEEIIKTEYMNSSELSVNKNLPKVFSYLQPYSDLITYNGAVDRGQEIAIPAKTESQVPVQSNVSQTDTCYSEVSNDTAAEELISWAGKHPENWTTTEVLDWLYYSAERNGIDCSLLRGESFRTLTGAHLCRMGADEFTQLEPNYGTFLFKMFRQLVNGLYFSLPQDAKINFADHSSMESYYTSVNAHVYYNSVQSSHDTSSQSQYVTKPLFEEQQSHSGIPEGNTQYISRKDAYGYEYDSPSTSISRQDGVESIPIDDYDYSRQRHHNPYGNMYGYDYSVTSCHVGTSHDRFDPTQSKVAATRAKYKDGVTPRRRPGRPRIRSLPTEEELAAQREKKFKNQHLWEFIYELLKKPAYNPSILKWENQSEGVFRFIQSETVAQLWGTLKSNENMTYEKLSRAMRHYYKRGILERVEGRRLVYKFSQGTLQKMKEKQSTNINLER